MAETIKEYLVALGFKVDEQGLKKFDSSIANTISHVKGFGEAMALTAFEIQKAVTSVANQMEDLFWVSQRTQSSVTALQAFEYGAKQIGVTAGSARGAVEGLAAAMRGSPGISTLLNTLGVKTQGRGALEIMTDLIGQLKKMPFYMASQYASMVGIDPQTLLMMEQRFDALKVAEADHTKRQKEAGINADDLAGKSNKLNTALRQLDDDLGILGERFAVDFIDPLTKGVKILDEFVQWINRADNATNGWVVTLGSLASSVAALWLAKKILGSLFGRGAAAAAEAGAGAAAGGAGGAGLGSLVGKALKFGGRFLGPVGAFLGMTEPAGEGEDADVAAGKGRGGGRNAREDATPSATATARGRQASAAGGATGQAIVNQLIGLGWSKENAQGIAANLYSESGYDPASKGDYVRGQPTARGLMNWHKPGQDEFEKWSGHDIGSASTEEQVRFIDWWLKHGADTQARQAAQRMQVPGITAGQSAALISSGAERPHDQFGEMSKRAALADSVFGGSLSGPPSSVAHHRTANISQKTDIIIQGGPDAAATARATAAAQSDVNGDLTRNTMGALR